MKIKVVITGGAGFIGSHLSKKLLNLGYAVHIIDNLSHGKKSNVPKGAVLHMADIRENKKISAVFKNARYVFHLAAFPSVEYSITHPEETFEINEVGTLNVLSLSNKNGVKKLIFASSSSVYGDQKTEKLKENLLPNPKSPYALQKFINEQRLNLWASLYGINSISLRFFNVYGQGQNEDGAYAFIIAKFLKYKRENKPLPITGDGKQSRDFIHINDVVNACIMAMKAKTTPGDVINIGGGRKYTITEIASLFGDNIVHIPKRIEPKSTLSNNSKAKKILNWSPKITLKEGVNKLLH